MKWTTIALMLGAGIALGGGIAQAKLPAPTDAQKTAAAEKAAADKVAAAKEADLLGKYQDKAAANYKRGKGGMAPSSKARK